MNRLLSVVMPVRNAEGTVAVAVESILSQDYSDFEFMIVDDGSVDTTRDVLSTFRDSRMTVMENPGRPGVANAMQVGVDATKGRWIARMDADDRSLPQRLGRQLAIAKERPDCAAVRCGVRLIESLGEGMTRYVDWANSLQDPESVAAARFIESPVIHPSSMMCRDWLNRIGGYREVSWAEDHDLWMRLLACGGVVETEPEVLFEWRDSAGRLTRTNPDYGSDARMNLRVHYLSNLARIERNGVVIAGAGPIGKTLAVGLRQSGIEVHGFFEVSERRIGQIIHGVPVIDSDESSRYWTDAVLLGAVGIPGGRQKVRDLALKCGRREGDDFWSIC